MKRTKGAIQLVFAGLLLAALIHLPAGAAGPPQQGSTQGFFEDLVDAVEDFIDDLKDRWRGKDDKDHHHGEGDHGGPGDDGGNSNPGSGGPGDDGGSTPPPEPEPSAPPAAEPPPPETPPAPPPESGGGETPPPEGDSGGENSPPPAEEPPEEPHGDHGDTPPSPGKGAVPVSPSKGGFKIPDVGGGREATGMLDYGGNSGGVQIGGGSQGGAGAAGGASGGLDPNAIARISPPPGMPGAFGSGGSVSGGSVSGGSVVTGGGVPPPPAGRGTASSAGSTAGAPSSQGRALAHLRAAEMSIQEEDFQTALYEAEDAIAADPNDAAGYLLKARALNRLGRYAEAEAAAWKAVSLGSGGDEGRLAEAYQELSWAELNQGPGNLAKYKDAIAHAARAAELGGGAGRTGLAAKALATQAYACEALGRRDCVLSKLEAAARLDARFKAQLAAARAGRRVFEPGTQDSWRLLEAVSGFPGPGDGRRAPWLWGGAAAALGGFALLGWMIRRRKAASAELPGAPLAAGADRRLGKYELRRVIADSPGASVWLGFDPTLGREVKIREIPRAGAAGAADAAKALALLGHPNIIDLFEVLESGGGTFLVFEFLEGRTVRKILEGSGMLSLEGARKILGPVCGALAAAHSRGIVHGRLRPEAIIVSSAGFVKAADFSLGAAPQQGDPYAAPELFRGASGPAADVYSLGICLFELLAGRRPDGPLSGLRETGAGSEIDALISRSLEPDPARRITGPEEFASLLQGLSANIGVK